MENKVTNSESKYVNKQLFTFDLLETLKSLYNRIEIILYSSSIVVGNFEEIERKNSFPLYSQYILFTSRQ